MKTASNKTASSRTTLFQRGAIALALAGVVAGTAVAASLSPTPSQDQASIEPVLMAQHMAQRSWITAQNTAASDMMMARADTPAPGMGPGAMSPEERQARMEERLKRHEARRTERLNALKAELKITPEQEAAWLAFVSRTAPDTSKMKERMAQRDDWQKLTTPERIDRMQTMHAEHQANMNKRLEAVKSLYAALSPEQQKVFDQKGMHGMMGGKHGAMRDGKGGRHGHQGMHGEGRHRMHGQYHEGGRHHGKHSRHGGRGEQCEGMQKGGRMGPNGPVAPDAPEEQAPAKS